MEDGGESEDRGLGVGKSVGSGGRKGSVSLHDRPRAIYAAAFDMYDTDGNGSIDAEELAELLAQLGWSTDERTVDNALLELDSGNTRSVAKADFVQWAKFAWRKQVLSGSAIADGLPEAHDPSDLLARRRSIQFGRGGSRSSPSSPSRSPSRSPSARTGRRRSESTSSALPTKAASDRGPLPSGRGRGGTRGGRGGGGRGGTRFRRSPLGSSSENTVVGTSASSVGSLNPLAPLAETGAGGEEESQSRSRSRSRQHLAIPGSGGNTTASAAIRVDRPRAIYEAAFRRYDVDDSGEIDSSELQGLLRDLGWEDSPEAVQDAIHALDADANSTIELEEFLEFAKFAWRSQVAAGTAQADGIAKSESPEARLRRRSRERFRAASESSRSGE